MNIKDLRTQIYSVGSTVTGSNGFFYQQAPDDVTFPYIVYNIIDDVNERISVGKETDDILIQFNLYDKRITTKGNKVGPTALEAVANNLITKFNSSSILIPGYGTLLFRRTLMTPSILEEGGYWNIAVRYSLLITN